jgi:hypothetical protein
MGNWEASACWGLFRGTIKDFSAGGVHVDAVDIGSQGGILKVLLMYNI